MTWLAWRQLRAQLLLATACTLVIAAVLVLTRAHISRVAGTEDVTTLDDSLRLLGTGLIGLPVLIGAFWGAPMLARELEAGTHRLAWTQSVTRSEWLARKLAVPAVAAIALTAAFSLLFTWWSAPFDHTGNRIGTANFGQRGIAPIAYALFALALGALLGMVTRKTLPAMAATMASFFVTRFAFQLLVRSHLVKTIAIARPSALFGSDEALDAGRGAWVLGSHMVDGAGHPITERAVERLMVDGCGLSRDTSVSENIACIKRLGIQDILRAHPANQFWALQLWEAAAFVALAAVLTVACFWWLRHRVS